MTKFMDKIVLESAGAPNLESIAPPTSHPSEEFLTSCDGWVRPSSQTKCKTLLHLLQEHVIFQTTITSVVFEDTTTLEKT